MSRMRMRGQFLDRTAALAMLVAVSTATAIGCQTPPSRVQPQRGKPVIAIEHKTGMQASTPVTVTPIPLRDAGTGALPRAAVTADGFTRIFGQAGGTSRLAGPVGDAKNLYSEKWHANVDPAIDPALVLRGGSRILLQGSNQWQLFDLSGAHLAKDQFGAGGAVIDDRPALFYVVDRNGFLAAHSQRSGALRFKVPLAGNEAVTRPLIARSGQRLLAVGVEQSFFPHRPTPPNRSMVQSFSMATPVKVTESGYLESIESTEMLRFESSRVEAALAGETLVVAVPGSIFFIESNLKITSTYTADFEPIWMSVDELKRAHLIVKEADGQHALWVVTPAGDRTTRVLLAADRRELIAPPIVGYDHRIYLVTRGLIVALTAEGKPLWQAHAPGEVVGAGVATDDRLLVSAGDALVAYGGDGKPQIVHSFGGDVLQTAPAMGEGEIVVASRRRVYTLARR